MRQYILIVFVLAFVYPYATFAQKYVTSPKQYRAEQVYDNLIYKLDIIQYLNIDSLHDKNAFWQSLDNKHYILQKYKDEVYRNKTTASKSQDYINNQLANYKSENFIFLKSNGIAEELKASLCGQNSEYPISISIIHNEYANAAILPNGEMYITDSLCYLLEFSKEKLLGICAHEMGHYIIQHAYIHQWKSLKKEKNKTTFAAVMSGLAVATDLLAMSQGVKVNSRSTSKYIENSFNSAKRSSYLYRFKYSREQELEADIIAVRFLEWLGIDPKHYIETLKILGTKYDLLIDIESNHPTTQYRIDFLSYLIKNYPLKNYNEKINLY